MNRKLFILVGGILSLLSSVNAQSLSFENPGDFAVCHSSGFKIHIANTGASSMTGAEIHLSFPCGLAYEPGSIAGGTEKDISNLSNPVFSIPDLTPGDTATILFSMHAPCTVAACVDAGQLFSYSVNMTYNNGQVLSASSGNFKIETSLVVFTKVENPVQQGVKGDVLVRKLTIKNTRPGPVKEIVFKDIHQEGIEITANMGTVVQSSPTEFELRLDSSDFVLTGNGNGVLEKDEELVLEEHIKILICPDQAASVQSTLSLDWGCNQAACGTSSLSSAVIFLQLDPAPGDILEFSPVLTEPDCYCGSSSYSQGLVITNTSDKHDAVNVSIEVTPGLFFLLERPVKIIRGSDTTEVTPVYGLPNNPEACFPGEKGYKQMLVTVDEILSGETVTVLWDLVSCNQGSCLQDPMAWSYKCNYFKTCTTPADRYHTTGQKVQERERLFSAALDADLAFDASQTVDYHISGYFLDKKEGVLSLDYLLPCGMSLEQPADLAIGGVQPLSVNTGSIGDQFHIALTYPTPLQDTSVVSSLPVYLKKDSACYEDFKLKDTLITSCGKICESSPQCSFGSNRLKIEATASWLSTNCPGSCPEQSCNSLSKSLGDTLTEYCFDTVPGYLSYSFELNRITYGLADNDDDHLPDAQGNLDFNLIRRDRAMAGDTVRTETRAVVVADVPGAAFPKAYLDMTILLDSTFGVNIQTKAAEAEKLFNPYSGLVNLKHSLRIFDKSAGIYYHCPVVPYFEAPEGNKLNQILRFDLSPELLATVPGSTVPPDFLFEDGDSIHVTTEHLVKYNFLNGTAFAKMILGFHPQIYLAHSPLDRSTKFVCNCKSATLEIANITYAMLNNLGGDLALCSGQNQGALVQISYGVLSNFFPFEYRTPAAMKELKVPEIEGVALTDAYIEQATSNGQYILNSPDTTQLHYSFVEPAVITYPQEDITGFYVFEEDDFPMDSWDDNVLLRVRFQYQNTGCSFFGAPNYEIQMTADVLPENPPFHQMPDSTYHLSLRGKGPSLNLDFLQCNHIELGDTVSWDMILSNALNQNCNNPAVDSAVNVWLTPLLTNNEITDIKLFNSLTGEELPAVNGIFQLGGLARCDTLFLKIKGLNQSCNPVSTGFAFGWSCTPFENPLLEPCEADTVVCFVSTAKGVVEVEPDTAVLISDLCAETPWMYCRVFNAGLGNVYEMKLAAKFPPGMIPAPGSSEVEWPAGSGNFQPIQDPQIIGASKFEWTLTDTSIIPQAAMPGVNASPQNTMVLRFKALTTCDFVSGAEVIYSVSGRQVCGLPTNIVTKPGTPVHISGISPPYSASLSGTVSGNTVCTDSIQLQLNIHLSSPAGAFDSLFAQLPQGISYVPGSCTGSFNCNPQIYPHSLSWHLPQGDSVLQLTFTLSGLLNADCAPLAIPLYSTSQAAAFCQGANQNCNIRVQTGSQILIIQNQKPFFTIDQFSILPQGIPDVTLSVTLTNHGSPNDAPVVVSYYLDTNANGQVDAGDSLLQTQDFNVSIPPDSSITLDHAMSLSPDDFCRLIAIVGQTGDCVCMPDTAQVSGPVKIPAATTDTICSGDVLPLGITQEPGHSYQWMPAGGLDCDTCASTHFTQVNKSFNPVFLTYTLKDQSACLVEYEYQVMVLPEPGIWAADEAICVGGEATLVASDGATYNWSGPGISDPSQQIQLVTPSQTAAYTVTVTNAKGCQAVDSATVTVLPVPEVNAGEDLTVCPGENVSLSGTVAFADDFAWSPGVPYLDNPQSLTPSVLTGESTSFVLTASNGVCEASDEVNVSFLPAVEIQVSGDTIACPGDTVTLLATGADSYAWVPAFPGMCQDTACSQVRFVADSSFYLTVYGSLAGGCQDTARLHIVVIEDTLFTSSDLTLCPGDTVDLFGEQVTQAGTYCGIVTHGSGCVEYQCVAVTIKDTILTTDSLTICEGEQVNFNGEILTSSGTYCQDTTSASGCDSTHCLVLEVLPAPELAILPGSAAIQPGDSVRLNATTGLASYQWSPSEGLSCDDCPNPLATPAVTTMYRLTVQDANGCTNTDSVLVTVGELCDLDFEMPNAFTPDGDGVNDVFRLPVHATATGAKLNIYDRWGQKVFEGDGQSGWDGTMIGRPMPPDAYVYIVILHCPAGKTKALKGNVILIR